MIIYAPKAKTGQKSKITVAKGPVVNKTLILKTCDLLLQKHTDGFQFVLNEQVIIKTIGKFGQIGFRICTGEIREKTDNHRFCSRQCQVRINSFAKIFFFKATIIFPFNLLLPDPGKIQIRFCRSNPTDSRFIVLQNSFSNVFNLLSLPFRFQYQYNLFAAGKQETSLPLRQAEFLHQCVTIITTYFAKFRQMTVGKPEATKCKNRDEKSCFFFLFVFIFLISVFRYGFRTTGQPCPNRRKTLLLTAEEKKFWKNYLLNNPLRKWKEKTKNK